MNQEQIEARILNQLEPVRIGDTYILPREVLLAVVGTVFAAGDLHGAKDVHRQAMGLIEVRIAD